MKTTFFVTSAAVCLLAISGLLQPGYPPAHNEISKEFAKALSAGCQGCAPRAGEEKTIMLPGDVPLVLVWVPPGTFQMGRYPGEQDSHASEDPRHAVILRRGFWMGKYEITQEQWLALYPNWPGQSPSANTGVGDRHPAYYVSWYDAKLYAALLNDHMAATGQGPLTARLPSEAEWEYACRAGTQTRYFFGDGEGCVFCSDCPAGTLPDNSGAYMWFCGNNPTMACMEVGGRLPNAFGLFDMSGNIREWCEDDFHGNYEGAPGDGSAWANLPRASTRVVRGGSANSVAEACRSGSRQNSAVPHARGYNIGFRVVGS